MLLLHQMINLSEVTPEKAQDLFPEKFGVNVIQEGDYYLFKYQQFSANWTFDITKECRGTILKYDKKWECVSYPFSKFFNHMESFCALNESHIPILDLHEKADGTCIQLWEDNNNWNISTLGSIKTKPLNGGQTFEQLFWGTCSIDLSKLNKDYTYLFELCTEANRIVSRYATDQVVILAARNKQTGKYSSEEKNKIIANSKNVRLPVSLSCKNNNLKTINDVLNFVEQESCNTKYGEYPEGFVGYIYNNFPIVKFKNKTYIKYHSLGGGDEVKSKKEVVNLFFKEELDDYSEFLPKYLIDFSSQLKDFFTKEQHEVAELWKCFVSQGHTSRKDKAIHIQKEVPKKFQGFFFENIEESQINPYQKYFEWVKKTFNKRNIVQEIKDLKNKTDNVMFKL